MRLNFLNLIDSLFIWDNKNTHRIQINRKALNFLKFNEIDIYLRIFMQCTAMKKVSTLLNKN